MTKRGRTVGRAFRLLVASAAVSIAAVPGVADAAQSVTNGAVKCTVTSSAPVLLFGNLTGSLNVVCTGVTTVEVISTMVEMDGSTLTVEDPTWVVRPTSTWVKITSSLVNKTVKVITTTVSCPNTDLNEKEEFATKAMLNLGGKTSSWDRTSPANNSYSC